MKLKSAIATLSALLAVQVFAAMSPTTCLSECSNALAITRSIFGCNAFSTFCYCDPHGRTSFVQECLVATCNNHKNAAAAYAEFLKRCPLSIWWSELPNLPAWEPTDPAEDYEEYSQLFRLGPHLQLDEHDDRVRLRTKIERGDNNAHVKKWLNDATSAIPLISATTQTLVHTLTITPAVSAILSTVTDLSAATYTRQPLVSASISELSAVSVLSSALTSVLAVPTNSTTTIYMQSVSPTSTVLPTSSCFSMNASITSTSMSADITAIGTPGPAVPSTVQIATTSTGTTGTTGSCTDCSTTITTVEPSSTSASCTTTLTVTAVLASSTVATAATESSTGGAAPTVEAGKLGLFMAWGVYAYYLHALG